MSPRVQDMGIRKEESGGVRSVEGDKEHEKVDLVGG